MEETLESRDGITRASEPKVWLAQSQPLVVYGDSTFPIVFGRQGQGGRLCRGLEEGNGCLS